MRGYTIIELTIILLIITILISLSYINMINYYNDSKLQYIQNLLLSDLELTKFNSIRREPFAIFIYEDRYEIRKLNDINNNFVRDNLEASELISSKDPIITMPKNIFITWNGCSGNKELWFDRKGVPRCKNWGLGMGTIKISNGKSFREIVISKNGRFKININGKTIE